MLFRSGRNIVARLVQGARKHPGKVVFLENYDMALGRLLTRGCDVWLNNPIRPLEASGTSGMKAAMNGVPNVSILDGWWPEACVDGVNGFAIGKGESGDDLRDLHMLYDTLEQRVLPAFADAKKWANIMVESVKSTEHAFSSERMMREYYADLYGMPDALPTTAPAAHE